MECDLRTLDPRVGLTPECFRLFHSFQWKRRGTGTGGPQLGHVPGNAGIVTVTAMPGRAETQWTDTARRVPEPEEQLCMPVPSPGQLAPTASFPCVLRVREDFPSIEDTREEAPSFLQRSEGQPRGSAAARVARDGDFTAATEARKCAGVARGAQVDSDVTGPVSKSQERTSEGPRMTATCRNGLCLLVWHLLALAPNRPPGGEEQNSHVSLCLGHPKCRGDW